MSDITLEQEDAIEALYENRLLVAKPGFGKTVVGATAVAELLADSWMKRVLIVAPLRVCKEAWGPVWSEWGHLGSVTWGRATGPEHERMEIIASDYQVVVINIENLVWFFKTYGHNHGFDGLLIDEISKFKAPGSALVKKLRHHLKDFTWRCGMSGTPVAEAPEDIFSQALIIDEGKALGRRKDRFMQNYFYQVDFQGYQWELREGAIARLTDDLKEVLYVADDASYIEGLPPLTIHRSLISMPQNAWDAYDALCADGLFHGEEVVEVPNAAVLQGKLQQICCGAVYNTVGTEWLHIAKYTALREIVENTSGNQIVVYQFDYEKKRLRQEYPNIRFLDQGAVDVNVNDWNDGKIPLLAIHPKSAGHGLNLQHGGHRQIWLSPIWSSDLWTQTIARTWRQGQGSPVDIWVLTVLNSVEGVILDRLDTKRAGEEDFIQHVKARRDEHATDQVATPKR